MKDNFQPLIFAHGFDVARFDWIPRSLKEGNACPGAHPIESVQSLPLSHFFLFFFPDRNISLIFSGYRYNLIAYRFEIRIRAAGVPRSSCCGQHPETSDRGDKIRRAPLSLYPSAYPPSTGIAINGPGGAAPPPPGGKRGKGHRPSSASISSWPPQGFLSSAASGMPAIAASKEELVAVLKLAGLKKPKAARVDRAWWALTSGESRSSSRYDDSGGGTFAMYYIRGGALAAKVAAAGLLRNPDFGVVLAATLAAALLLCRCGKLFGRGGSSGQGGEHATSPGGGDRGAAAAEEAAAASGGRFRSGGSKLGLPRRGHSSLSPRRLAGS